MSKARDLADFISTGAGTGILADGAISVSEISDLTATAADLNNVAGINTSVQTQLDGKQAVVANVSSTEIGYLDGVTSALQTQLDNISVTSGSLTKSFTSGETASITLAQAISPAPVVSATKEVPQVGIVSKGAWDVNASASNYDLHNTAYATTLTPSTTLDVTSSTYDNNSRSTGGSHGPRFSSDGLKLFVNDQGANNIRQYNLSTAWLLPSSATHTTFSTASQVSDESGFCFSDNGLHFYLCDTVYGSSSNTLHQYSITSGYPYDLVGYGSFTRTINMTSLGEATPQVRPISSVLVEDSGTKMYIFSGSGTSALIRQYTLSTAYDPSSATYDNKSFDIYADYGSGGYLRNSSLSSDGKQLLVANGADDVVMHYTLGTAWDISTASRIGTYDPAEDANVSGVHLKPDNSKFFVLGGSNQTLYRYTLGSSNALALGTGSFATTDVGKRIVGNGGDVTLTNTAGAYDTTGGSAFTDTSTIASGSWSMRGLKSVGDADGIGMPSVSNVYDVSNATATGNTFSVATQSASLLHMTFSPDGTKFYVIDYTNGYMMQYGCTTAFDLTTASYSSKTFYSYQQDGQPVAARFNPDGTNMLVAGRNNDRVYQYSLSTAYDISTASYSNTSWQPSSGKVNAGFADILFNNDGSFIYTLDYNTDVIGQFACPNEYQLSGVSSDSTYEYSLPTNSIATPQGMSFNSDGTKMYIIATNNKIDIYTLSTAYRVSTMSYSSTISINGGNMALDFSADGTKLFVASRESDNIIEYSVGEFFTPTSQYHVAVTNSGGQIDTSNWLDINTMVADQAAGDGTVHYAVSTDDRTTWSVIKEGSGVRPIVRDNSGTWQYNSDNVTSSSFAISGATYSGDAATFSTNGQDTQSYTVAVKPDGTKIYVASYNSDAVYQYDLSTAFDLSTASYNNVSFSFSSQMSQPRNIQFKSDGTEMYLLDASSYTIYQYTMSTPWDLSTASYAYSFATTSTTITPRGLAFKSDGTKMYITDGSTTNQYVYKYDLSTAWRVDTATYSSSDGALNITAQFTNAANSVMFNPTGTKMHVYDYGTRNLYEYDLSTAWDISTGSYNNVSVSLDPQPSSSGYGQPTTVYLDYTSGYLYAMRSERLFEWSGFTTSTLPYSTTTTWANSTTNNEFYALQQALSLANNRMDKTQLDAVTDPNHYTLGDTLDLAIALRTDTASASTPTADGVTINYDAASLNQGAVLGTDYDYDFPNSTTVRVTSNAAQNLKIRVV